MEKKPQLTVRDLIELLKKQVPEHRVNVQGCDCDGEATGVSFVDGEVMIERNP